MKKFYLFIMLFLFACLSNAQIKVQGVPRNDISGTSKLNTTAISFSDIQYWVGSGANQAAFVYSGTTVKIRMLWSGDSSGTEMPQGKIC